LAASTYDLAQAPAKRQPTSKVCWAHGYLGCQCHRILSRSIWIPIWYWHSYWYCASTYAWPVEGDSQGNIRSVIAWVPEGLVPAIRWHSGWHSLSPTGKWQPNFPRIYSHAIVMWQTKVQPNTGASECYAQQDCTVQHYGR
jgi:hypothetical protein